MGIERGRLRALAVENLGRILPRIEVHPGEIYSMITAGGNYEASLLLLDEIWDRRQFKVSGDIVVALPTRDVLLVTGSQNPAGIVKLREVAAQLTSQSPYHLTSDLFVRRGGGFKLLPRD